MTALIPTEVRVHRFHPNGLDPIAVYVEQYGPESSRMTVQCYSRAWTAYWGAHGIKGLERFVVISHVDYIIDNLTWGTCCLFGSKQEERERAYLRGIVQAIQNQFQTTQETS